MRSRTLMKYDELKNFLLYEMKMEKNRNYQPVMIRTLNQNDGKSTKEQIIQELHNANPGFQEDYFNNSPVFEILTIKHSVAKFNETDKKYHLLDYETFNPAEKAWITNYCDEKIIGQSEKKYFVLKNENEIENAQNVFLNNLKKYTTKKDKIIIGFPGPEEKVTDDVEYISSVNIWWHSQKLTDATIPRYWNCFGLDEPNWQKNNNIVLEINIPIKEISKRIKGAFVKDLNDNIYLTHNGVLGGGNTPGGFYDVYPHEERWIKADDGQKESRDLILISDISSIELPTLLADYIQNVAKYKSGELVSKKTPHYLLLRHKSEDNPYQDDPSGKVYHFPKIANYTKVVPNAKAIWFDRQDGDYYFWGFGTISDVKPRPDSDFDAIFENFALFEKEPDSLELFGKFLKKATPETQEKIINYPGWNMQNSILEISKEIHDEIIGNDKISVDDRFEIGHRLFLLEMSQKNHKTPFENFNHIDFVEEELNYKIQASENSLNILSLDKWDDWLSTPEKICQSVRDAIALKISKNLIWSPPYNTEKDYFDEFDANIISEFGKQLYNFFKGNDSIETRFDNLVSFLEKNNIKVEMRLLAYLMFLLDSTKYFPIHPSNFDNLLSFYQIQIPKEKSWKKYSLYLELASKIKSKLVKKYPQEELNVLQIQSYMWILATAVSKNYYLIRAGTDGSDWENQRSAGIIGIHYYTMNLNDFTNQNNQLSKTKVKQRIQEIRQEGNEPLSDAEISADYGQLQSIYTIKPKDKIVAIGNNSTLLGVGNATGKYQFRTDISNNCHTVPVDWYDVNLRQIPQQPTRRTIKNLSIKDYVDLMSPQIATQTFQYQEFINILEKKKQLIFYGPPGTGKTFTATQLSKEMIKNNSSTPTLTFRAAAIKILSEENKTMHYEEITKIALERNFVQTKGETPEFTLLKEMSHDIQKNGASSIFKKISKGKYSLNPDIELDEELKETKEQKHKFIRNVTFHQSYSYEEFIEGIKPHSIDGKVVYNIEPGMFRIICEEATADPENKYVLLIDEINRGNISKIFGESISLIEKDKRGTLNLQLAYSKDAFTVPENVYIIGTMNTADRSLIQIDAALRRRFAFYELMPKPELLTEVIEGISLQKLLEEINKRITEAGLREKQVGHSYLMDIQNLEDLQFAFANEIVPLLQDYFFDDYKKLEEDILSSDFIDSENMIVKDEWKESSQKFLDSLKNTFQL